MIFMTLAGSYGHLRSWRFTVLLVFLWIDIDHSKFQPRSVSHREAVRRAHPSPSLSFTNNISLVV